ncbi:YtnP family quorum-quenching lactonase [Fervidibacillus halotolerans]|uniref:MBL fold metallo-hydrolase n=1 Tax=Fervidibacillus halotolerans TaxID=2980027 RepID=A0A9E8LXY6_9BACI|nr:MBL fold metallo-hydrolase [Fervidibacillus halotolerans]WAA11755.1 MBL fold metallo-hydrolase [Fervidibacillus halotolerans]
MDQLKIGDITLTWLKGGMTHLDGGAMFGVVPKPLWSKKYAVNEKNQIPLRTDPILIETGKKNILIESGIGNGKLTEKQKRNFGVTEESKLEESLREKQLHLSDIDIVLMTHMHFDHASGLTNDRGSVFPNATIYCSEKEWKEMRNPTIRSKATYWEKNWKGIEDQVVAFEHELEVFPGIRIVHTGGHSFGHAIVLIESKGEMAIHMADLMPTHAHKNPLWVMAYDDYPMDSIREKEKWITFGEEYGVWFTFYHDAVYRAIQWGEANEIHRSLPIQKAGKG